MKWKENNEKYQLPGSENQHHIDKYKTFENFETHNEPELS